jgi:hypothetical protein
MTPTEVAAAGPFVVGAFDASLCKPSGLLITEPLDGGPKIYHDTYRCRHCQRHWVHVKNKARQRGYCVRCCGPVCGNRDCADQCIPAEARLENVEAGRPELTPPRVLVAFPETLP